MPLAFHVNVVDKGTCKRINICSKNIVVLIGSIELSMDSLELEMFIYPDSAIDLDYNIVENGKIKPVYCILKSASGNEDEIYEQKETINNIKEIVSDPYLFSTLLNENIVTVHEERVLDKFELRPRYCVLTNDGNQPKIKYRA